MNIKSLLTGIFIGAVIAAPAATFAASAFSVTVGGNVTLKGNVLTVNGDSTTLVNPKVQSVKAFIITSQGNVVHYLVGGTFSLTNTSHYTAPAATPVPVATQSSSTSCAAVQDVHQLTELATAQNAWHPANPQWERHVQFWTNVAGKSQALVWVKIAAGDSRGLIGGGSSWAFPPNCGADADWAKITGNPANTIVTMDQLAQEGLVTN